MNSSFTKTLLLPCVLFGVLQSIANAQTGTGTLELTSKPGGADVFVNGKKKGSTPETEGQKLSMTLAEGDHEVEIKKEGVGSAKRKIFVGEGVIQPLTMTIQAEIFTNSLGMKFVPVPGTQILMCIHETRNKDYAAYAAENSGTDSQWKNVSFDFGEKGKLRLKDDSDHPVVNVSWKDANAFCAWLGKKEGKTYRLPADHEWSCAVGIGAQENAFAKPVTKNGQLPGYPWGTVYPPPNDNVGNYWDSTLDKKDLNDPLFDSTDLVNYSDGSILTAKVMKYPANKLGIFDLGGNVREWCLDFFEPGESNFRVSRGGSWQDFGDEDLMSSIRDVELLDTSTTLGFRCVVVVGRSAP